MIIVYKYCVIWKIKPLWPRMLCALLGWTQWFNSGRFLDVVNVFLLCYYYRLKRALSFILQLEHSEYSGPKFGIFNHSTLASSDRKVQSHEGCDNITMTNVIFFWCEKNLNPENEPTYFNQSVQELCLISKYCRLDYSVVQTISAIKNKSWAIMLINNEWTALTTVVEGIAAFGSCTGVAACPPGPGRTGPR